MNENEKNLFYRVLDEKNAETPTPELTSNIMHIIHKKVHRREVLCKIAEVFGYSLLITIPAVFVGFYLYFYTDFKLPALHFSFEIPSRVYIITIFIIFVFSLIQLYFRQKLYERN
jgi:hypothetical protein